MAAVTPRQKPLISVDVKLEQYENLGMTPWFSYSINLPVRPFPELSERKEIKTERLILRPITLDDLDGFHELRRRPELQKNSKLWGRLVESKEESKRHLEALVEDYESHWYFGAFLQSTGEMIGEGGQRDAAIMATSFSGWPEAEFFIKPEYWRQGYGTEFFKAFMESWWDLPRKRRPHQIIPLLAPGLEPGDRLKEGVIFQWEDGNVAAREFIAKMLTQAPVHAEGGFESIDMREGREGQLVRWVGTLSENPRPEPPEPEEDEDSD